MPGKMKQVAVRMPPKLHKRALKMAKREKVTFGRFVRQAVDSHIRGLERWQPSGEVGWMSSRESDVL